MQLQRFFLFVWQQGHVVALLWVVAKALELRQQAGEPQGAGRVRLWLVPVQTGSMGGRCGAWWLGEQAVVYAGVFQVCPAAAGDQLVGGQGNARLCIHGPRCGFAHLARQQVVQIVRLELKGCVRGFKSRLFVRRLTGCFEMPQVAVQHHHIHPAHGSTPMPPHAPGQLDERAHGRGLHHRPVVVVVASYFGDGAAKHDEQVVLFRVGVDEGTQGGAL